MASKSSGGVLMLVTSKRSACSPFFLTLTIMPLQYRCPSPYITHFRPLLPPRTYNNHSRLPLLRPIYLTHSPPHLPLRITLSERRMPKFLHMRDWVISEHNTLLVNNNGRSPMSSFYPTMINTSNKLRHGSDPRAFETGCEG